MAVRGVFTDREVMRAAALLQRLPHAGDTERHQPRRQRPKRGPRLRVATAMSGRETTGESGSPGASIVQRTRAAGGPIDNASYTCACGFVFAASVSTTVRCPHCGADQAW